MSRAEVLEGADSVDYFRRDVEVVGQELVELPDNLPIEKIPEVYYFRNVVLPSVIEVDYDNEGKVNKVIVDQVRTISCRSAVRLPGD